MAEQQLLLAEHVEDTNQMYELMADAEAPVPGLGQAKQIGNVVMSPEVKAGAEEQAKWDRFKNGEPINKDAA